MMTTDDRSEARPGQPYAGSAVQKAALAAGVAFLLVGVAGFVPGLTHGLEHLQPLGHGSEAYLLGLFQVSVLHNAVHLLFGVVGVVSAIRPAASRHYLLWGGVVYLALWVYGLFLAGREGDVIPLNAADNVLHLVLAVLMILSALLIGRRGRPRATGVRALD